MKGEKCCGFGASVLRLVLGPLFVIPGVSKLMNPGMIIGMLGSLGFPAPVFWGWLLLLSEIIFGASVFLGFKVKYAVWPLVVVLLVATVTVYLPKLATDPTAIVNVLFHLLGIASLVSVFLTGAGAWAVDKE